MPRVHDAYVDCVVYIYGSMADAKAGVRQGGSGFLTQVVFTENPEWSQLYVITNRHVVAKAKTPVVRLNKFDGTVEYFPTTLDQWAIHPSGDDVTALTFQPAHWDRLRMISVPRGMFLTDALVKKEDIGIGDETFMIGRFINHEGKQRNIPAIRFGNVAMMPVEKITSEEGLEQESFLVEVRSLPGYSGSPVFLYSVSAAMDFSRRDLAETAEALREQQRKTFAAQHGPGARTTGLDAGLLAGFTPKGPYLLGIDWCHLHSTEKVRGKDGKILPDGSCVRTNSGMAGVIPAWKIAELLDSEELKAMRRVEDEKLSKSKRESSVSLDSAEETLTPFTKEDFETALKKASRKIERKGS